MRSLSHHNRQQNPAISVIATAQKVSAVKLKENYRFGKKKKLSAGRPRRSVNVVTRDLKLSQLLRSVLICAHREVAGFWQDVHCFCHLRIVRHDENSVANHSTVSGSYDIEAQLELDESAIAIDHRRCHFVRRIGSHEIAKRLEHRIRDLELFRLQLVTEIDPAIDTARLKTTNTTVHQFARESKSRTQQTALS